MDETNLADRCEALANALLALADPKQQLPLLFMREFERCAREASDIRSRVSTLQRDHDKFKLEVARSRDDLEVEYREKIAELTERNEKLRKKNEEMKTVLRPMRDKFRDIEQDFAAARKTVAEYVDTLTKLPFGYWD